ncbi:hypothetical protein L596_016122 [Steinernema carpocapsae]|uniref:Uncharacterized protein n=1 Tax=Steinernema carpocapsae TaxID=34508 RepID=A0A4U5NH60_STECR|nr:hypothetical protein L596_016122 [Steinernema carpocapsae]
MGKKTTLRKASSAGVINRRISLQKPEIVIDKVSNSSNKHISISAGGITTFRWSSLALVTPFPLAPPDSPPANRSLPDPIILCSLFRRSSDDCIRRSSSEIIGGVTFPSNHESRRGSAMSNSSASLQLHDMHQLSIEVEQHHEATRKFENVVENDQVEIFV